ncbi:hypothetical protein Q1695_009548 [Nippostrongylus brasiliensis]|nr:hypothetical protein Q1695_009548 [Nippostrongylus brasiliensis]
MDEDWGCAPAAAGDGFGESKETDFGVNKKFGQSVDDDWGTATPRRDFWGEDTNVADVVDDETNGDLGFGGVGRSTGGRGRGRGFGARENNSGRNSVPFGDNDGGFDGGDRSGRGGFRGRGGSYASRGNGFGTGTGFAGNSRLNRETNGRAFGSSFEDKEVDEGFGSAERGFGEEFGRSTRGRGAGNSRSGGRSFGDDVGFGGESYDSGRGGGAGRGRGARRGRDGGFGGLDRDNHTSDKRFGGFESSGFGSSGFGSSGDGFGQQFGSKRNEDSPSCYNCGQKGHQSHNCNYSGNAGFGSGGYRNQQGNGFGSNEGHGFGRRWGDDDERRFGGQACYNCGARDHLSRECPNPPRPRRNDSGHEQKKPPSTFVPQDEEIDVLFKQHIEQGEMFTKLFEAEVTLTEGGLNGRSEKGRKISSFEDLELPEELAKNVVSSGYTRPTPIQQYAMPAIFKGRDIMACAQTGSGKTAAFLLPVMTALIRSGNLCAPNERTCYPRCLIIAPTRELAVQIYNEGRKFAHGTGLTVACCYGGTSVHAQRTTLARGATILVATVGRLEQFLNEGSISLRETKYLVLDEADRMLEMGFKDSMNFVLNHPTLTAREERQTFMFSATFPRDVQMVASQQLKSDFLMITVGKIGVANKCISQEIIECNSIADKKEKFFELLNIDLKKYEINKEADVFKQKTMVFVTRKMFADTLGVLLSECGIPSTTIHGDRYQDQRAQALNDFKYGKKPILIATAVGERGLDIKGVDHVINYDLPTNGQDYVHRIGRTGRVGNPGRATSLYLSEENKDLAQSLVEILTEADQMVPEFLARDANGGEFSRFGGFGSSSQTAGNVEDEEW